MLEKSDSYCNQIQTFKSTTRNKSRYFSIKIYYQLCHTKLKFDQTNPYLCFDSFVKFSIFSSLIFCFNMSSKLRYCTERNLSSFNSCQTYSKILDIFSTNWVFHVIRIPATLSEHTRSLQTNNWIEKRQSSVLEKTSFNNILPTDIITMWWSCWRRRPVASSSPRRGYFGLGISQSNLQRMVSCRWSPPRRPLCTTSQVLPGSANTDLISFSSNQRRMIWDSPPDNRGEDRRKTISRP